MSTSKPVSLPRSRAKIPSCRYSPGPRSGQLHARRPRTRGRPTANSAAAASLLASSMPTRCRRWVTARSHRRPSTPAVEKQYEATIAALASGMAGWLGDPGVLVLTEAAHETMKQIERSVEPKLARDGDLASRADWGAKFVGCNRHEETHPSERGPWSAPQGRTNASWRPNAAVTQGWPHQDIPPPVCCNARARPTNVASPIPTPASLVST